MHKAPAQYEYEVLVNMKQYFLFRWLGWTEQVWVPMRARSSHEAMCKVEMGLRRARETRDLQGYTFEIGGTIGGELCRLGPRIIA